MRVIRSATYEEYVEWYLRREQSQKGRKGRLFDQAAIPPTMALRRQEIAQKHSGKIRPWFDRGTWHVVELESVNELCTLICLDNTWTRKAQLLESKVVPNYRLLSVLVRRAHEHHYFDLQPQSGVQGEELEKRQAYLTEFRNSWPPTLRGPDRVVLCSPWPSEQSQNPWGTYYLHDGLGRLLAYVYLIAHDGKPFFKVEAFLAEDHK